MKDVFRHRNAKAHEKAHQGPGKVFCRKGAAHESRQGDGHLDRGQEPGRLLRQGRELLCPLISVVGHAL